jgi:hypothetical protein
MKTMINGFAVEGTPTEIHDILVMGNQPKTNQRNRRSSCNREWTEPENQVIRDTFAKHDDGVCSIRTISEFAVTELSVKFPDRHRSWKAVQTQARRKLNLPA